MTLVRCQGTTLNPAGGRQGRQGQEEAGLCRVAEMRDLDFLQETGKSVELGGKLEERAGMK